MTGKERIYKAIKKETPDRLPCFYRGHQADGALVKEAFGCDSMYELVDVSPFITLAPSKYFFAEEKNGVVYDEFGIGRKQFGFHMEIVDYPLASVNDPKVLDDINWPNPKDPSRYTHMREQALYWKSKGKAIAAFAAPGNAVAIFEPSWYMTGMEKYLIDMCTNKPFAEALLDKHLSLLFDFWEMTLEEIGDLIDIACIGDDLAHQNDLLISPQLYRDLIKPRHKALIEFIKSRTDAFIFYHSCGNISRIINDFIEIGIDILDPTQPGALDTKAIKNNFGDSMTFMGGVNVQHTLPFGSTDEVKQEVRQRFMEIGHSGGFIIGPAHWLQPDTPDENIIAMYNEVYKCIY